MNIHTYMYICHNNYRRRSHEYKKEQGLEGAVRGVVLMVIVSFSKEKSYFKEKWNKTQKSLDGSMHVHYLPLSLVSISSRPFFFTWVLLSCGPPCSFYCQKCSLLPQEDFMLPFIQVFSQIYSCHQLMLKRLFQKLIDFPACLYYL